MEIVDAHIRWNPVQAPPTPIGPGIGAPSAFGADLELEDGMKVTLEVEVIDRVPRCVALIVRGADVASRDLRLPVLRWLDAVVAAVAMTATTNDGVTTIRPATARDEDDRVMEATQRSTRRRRHVTDDVLERTAQAYRQNNGQVEAVQGVLNVSEATAYRYIRRAREAGILEHREG